MLADSVRVKTRHHSDSSSCSDLTPPQRSCHPMAALMDRGYERLHAGVSLEVSDMNLFEAYAFCERYFPLSAAATSRSNGRAVSRASSLSLWAGKTPVEETSEYIDELNEAVLFCSLTVDCCRDSESGSESPTHGHDSSLPMRFHREKLLVEPLGYILMLGSVRLAEGVSKALLSIHLEQPILSWDQSFLGSGLQPIGRLEVMSFAQLQSPVPRKADHGHDARPASTWL
ncbi:hypothetical protein FOZ63_025442 [Perkinsus olseni]|uniref:Uncharacterized protein n=1 Tax=Perkinsus olseni TaxID=32597 RepID=A0A7J6NWT0_PEROL|nr:hypothetical protein FOZ60_002865 [Perkinsus olseni]KAF4736891.1 hypothetical protein FOZ63_025442 [Perkinsus olseni]